MMISLEYSIFNIRARNLSHAKLEKQVGEKFASSSSQGVYSANRPVLQP